MEMLKVIMVRSDLENIPQHPLPAGYSLRFYRDGDAATWTAIEQAADKFYNVTGERFVKEFGTEIPLLFQRCYFLVSPDGRDIGTTTAWYDRKYQGKRWGRVHWVAVVPEFQGKGLGKAMLSSAMNRLRMLGHRRAILGTQTPRLAAINMYLDFGFVPDMTTDNAAKAWKIVREALPHPKLKKLLL
ncbi:MAG: GNAT family N-acetyltransferase [Planctomycetaceae bacterium]|nr:MAG: GNAT family N-acetyltransferase [Planctomycetaceae bacterium]